jgi:hypothetical protein
MRKRIEVDLTFIDNCKPHWLSSQGRHPEILARIRAKYRAKPKAEREAKKVER